ncbi:MAG: hypothetical protein R3C49_13460 [Planctomycetaceae bacterium]
MKAKLLMLSVALAAATSVMTPATAEAGYRQYYSSWNYHPTRSYHYTRYYYKPTPTYSTYSYHYCISYPSQPRYVYYYNPHARQYWGRFDLEGKDGAQYSLLKPEDRKENLKDIPESAFPPPAQMPVIPEATDATGTKSDGTRIEPIKELPPEAPEDVPAGSSP